MPISELSDQHAYLRRVTLPFVLPTSAYGAMLVIWHLRPNLQMRFPLHQGQARDYVRYLAWCATEGRRDYEILCSIPEWDRELAQPIHLPRVPGDEWDGMIPVVTFLYGVAHCQYTFGGMLKNARVRRDVARSYWRGERHRRHSPGVAPWLRQALLGRFSSIEGLVRAIRIPRHDRKKSDLQLFRRFHLLDVEKIESDPYGRGGDPSSCHVPTVAHLPKGLTRSALRVPRPLLPALSLVESINQRPDEFQQASVTRLVSTDRRGITRPKLPFGVNLYGYARGELGIGEDVRLAAAALRTQGIPFSIINVEPGKEISQEDHSAHEWISKKPPYAINLLCITGVEQARLTCERGVGMLGDRYNIGLSPWELPHWPASCQHTYGAVDELWGISSYTARAFATAPLPVRAMTLPVQVGEVSTDGRREFGLPEKPFLFVFSFDIHSSIARKNPEGVIRAFQQAFPREGPDEVGLVLKVNVAGSGIENLNLLERIHYYLHKQYSWNGVKAKAAGDPRIHFIEESMRRPRVMALYKACDCYVSLHRAEGFGRGIAEAMLLGKQVITTGFSGNMDFCKEPRVALVRHKLRALEPGEYYWGDGQVWAEPDIDHAAELMRDVHKNPRDTSDPGYDFSPEAVGRIYAKRLEEIRVGLGI
jgi:glycosyltransferase involved in cell wall biosynthesis